MKSKLHTEIKEAHLKLKADHADLANRFFKSNEAYEQGKGGDYEKAKKKVADLEEKIESSQQRIDWLKESFRDLFEKTSGEMTKDVKNVLREKSEEQDVLDALREQLDKTNKANRLAWIDANDSALELRNGHELVKSSWVNLKVHEALSNCPYGLVEALVLDEESTMSKLMALVREHKESGQQITPALGEVPPPHLLCFHDEPIAEGIRQQQLRELIELEIKGEQLERQNELRLGLGHAVGLACPPNGV